MSGPIRPAPTKYGEALRAYHLAAAEWLGLDPAKVLSLRVDRGRDPSFRDRGPMDPGRLVEVTWEAFKPLTPRVGHIGAPRVQSDGETLTFSGSVVLDYDDGHAFLDAIGPEPAIFG